MATDIAFALAVLALLGDRVPGALKIFLTALAVADDLVAVVVIAVFYTAEISIGYLLAAVGLFGVLVVLNRLRVVALWPYLVGGLVLWMLMSRSGVHATVTGVALAFAIPFTGRGGNGNAASSPSHRLEHMLQKPVALAILPIFALANTAVVISGGAMDGVLSHNGLGIIAGLLIGKPVGITLASFAAVALGVCRLPVELTWRHVAGAGMVGGIGFTMSIFITNLAFPEDASLVASSKLAILVASTAAGALGYIWLRAFGEPVGKPGDD
jgi:NhaA family Na+:H+ antiporter